MRQAGKAYATTNGLLMAAAGPAAGGLAAAPSDTPAFIGGLDDVFQKLVDHCIAPVDPAQSLPWGLSSHFDGQPFGHV